MEDFLQRYGIYFNRRGGETQEIPASLRRSGNISEDINMEENLTLLSLYLQD
jgi:hypothetical protein